jgi:hypothetical protein
VLFPSLFVPPHNFFLFFLKVVLPARWQPVLPRPSLPAPLWYVWKRERERERARARARKGEEGRERAPVHWQLTCASLPATLRYASDKVGLF